MNQKYINTVTYDIEDKLDQIFLDYKIPDHCKLELVNLYIAVFMEGFEELMEKYEEEASEAIN